MNSILTCVHTIVCSSSHMYVCYTITYLDTITNSTSVLIAVVSKVVLTVSRTLYNVMYVAQKNSPRRKQQLNGRDKGYTMFWPRFTKITPVTTFSTPAKMVEISTSIVKVKAFLQLFFSSKYFRECYSKHDPYHQINSSSKDTLTFRILPGTDWIESSLESPFNRFFFKYNIKLKYTKVEPKEIRPTTGSRKQLTRLFCQHLISGLEEETKTNKRQLEHEIRSNICTHNEGNYSLL